MAASHKIIMYRARLHVSILPLSLSDNRVWFYTLPSARKCVPASTNGVQPAGNRTIDSWSCIHRDIPWLLHAHQPLSVAFSPYKSRYLSIIIHVFTFTYSIAPL